MEARIALAELAARVAAYDVDAAGIERVHSINVRGFAALPDDGDAALMPRFDPQPDRRPDGGDRRLVGHRRRATAGPWPRRPSGGARGASGRGVRGGGGRAIRRRGRRGRRAAASTWPTPARWTASPGRGRGRLRTRRDPRVQRGQDPAGLGARHRRPRTSRRCYRVNVGGAHRLVRAFGPAWSARRRGDLDLRHLRRRGAPEASHGGLRRLQVGPRGVRHRAADGARGDGRAGHRRAARPDPDRHGDGLGPRGDRRGASTEWAALGSGPPLRLPASRRRGARPSPHAVGRTAGTHLSVRGGPARGTVRHERRREHR